MCDFHFVGSHSGVGPITGQLQAAGSLGDACQGLTGSCGTDTFGTIAGDCAEGTATTIAALGSWAAAAVC